MRFLIAGGGTGGHFFPALAVSEELTQRKHEVLYVGCLGGIEENLGIPSAKKVLLKVSGVVGRGLKGIFNSYKFVASSVSLLSIVRNFKPQVSVIFGGYASLPAGVLSYLLKIPLYIQEQNIVPGRVNRLLSRFSSACFVGFPAVEGFNNLPLIFTGNPTRKQITKTKQKKKTQILKKLGLTNKKTLLILGGSQGALWINEMFAKTAPSISKLPIQVIHLTGKSKKEDKLKEIYRDLNIKAVVIPFYEKIWELYRIADAAVSRAGALTISELAIYGIPTLFIPYPYAADQHQLKNAKFLASIGAALYAEQPKVTKQFLAETVERLLFDTILRNTLSENFLKFSKPNATKEIADIICETSR